MILTGVAPLVGGDVQIVPGSGLLTLLGASPLQRIGLSPGAGALTFGGIAPALLTDLRLTPATAALLLSGQLPGLGGSVQIIPGTGALNIVGFNPVLTAIGSALLEIALQMRPSVLSIALIMDAPTRTFTLRMED